MKEYVKPQVEIISLVAEETCTNELTLKGGTDLDLSTNPFND